MPLYLSIVLLNNSLIQYIAGNKQVGEVCGLCTDPEENYFCGHCEPGLECFDSTPNEIDNPMICRKIRGISE